jgi:hypothetical protein
MARVQLAEAAGQRGLRIDIKRRAELPGERFDRDTFTAKFVSNIAKIMHGAGV